MLEICLCQLQKSKRHKRWAKILIALWCNNTCIKAQKQSKQPFISTLQDSLGFNSVLIELVLAFARKGETMLNVFDCLKRHLMHGSAIRWVPPLFMECFSIPIVPHYLLCVYQYFHLTRCPTNQLTYSVALYKKGGCDAGETKKKGRASKTSTQANGLCRFNGGRKTKTAKLAKD